MTSSTRNWLASIFWVSPRRRLRRKRQRRPQRKRRPRGQPLLPQWRRKLARLRRSPLLQRRRRYARFLQPRARRPLPHDRQVYRQRGRSSEFRCVQQRQLPLRHHQRLPIRWPIQLMLRMQLRRLDRASLLRERRHDQPARGRPRQARRGRRPLNRERPVQRAQYRLPASDSRLDLVSQVNHQELIKIGQARRKECVRQRHPDKFVPAVRRGPAVRRDREALREDFRKGRMVGPDQNRSVASGPVPRVDFRRRSPASRCTRASHPRRAGARQSKNDMRKANGGFIPCARAPARLPAAQHMLSPWLRSSASRERSS